MGYQRSFNGRPECFSRSSLFEKDWIVGFFEAMGANPLAAWPGVIDQRFLQALVCRTLQFLRESHRVYTARCRCKAPKNHQSLLGVADYSLTELGVQRGEQALAVAFLDDSTATARLQRLIRI